jgi:hypothetical protein
MLIQAVGVNRQFIIDKSLLLKISGFLVTALCADHSAVRTEIKVITSEEPLMCLTLGAVSLVPKIAGSNPAEAVGSFFGRKNS